MQWFKHDANAHRDTKLKKLMMRHGMTGYGLYFYCLELITDSISSSNLTFQLEDDAEVISHETGIHQEDIENMMRYMVELGLFEESNGIITCYKLAKRLDQSMTSNKAFRAKLKKVNHDTVMTPSENSHDTIMSRIEENRREEEKNRKDKEKTQPQKRKRFVPPSYQEVFDYMVGRINNPQIEAQNFVNYYESNGWMVGRNKMKSWTHAASGWINRANARQTQNSNQPLTGSDIDNAWEGDL